MRIVIDLQAAQTESSANRGIGRYSLSFIRELLKTPNDHEYFILLNNKYPKAVERIKKLLADSIRPSTFVVIDFPQAISFVSDSTGSMQRVMEVIREGFIEKLKPDHILICSLFEGFEDNAAVSVKSSFNTTTSVVLYDLIPLIFPEQYLSNSRSRAWYLQKLTSLKRADLLLAISESSKSDAVDYLGINDTKIVNISSAADDIFEVNPFDILSEIMLEHKYGIKKPFILYTGGNDFRKNIIGLLRAYVLLPPTTRSEYQLVIVCAINEHAIKYYMKQVESFNLASEDVIFTGFVPDDHLRQLYTKCSLFVFPSMYEGFGLPVLEAMRCGAPVICSNTSSMPEIVGLDDCLFDPGSVTSIADKIFTGVSDSDLNKKLRDNSSKQATKFNWRLVAQTAIESIERLKISNQRIDFHVTTSLAKKSIAIISPFPPLQSGISVYSHELSAELAQYYDVTLITNQKIIEKSIDDQYQWRSVDYFARNYHFFDRILYQFGNSEFHDYMFDLVKHYPGIVVLHDLYLSGIKLWLGNNYPGEFERSLVYSHGLPALHYLMEHGHRPTLLKYTMNKDVIDASMGVVVHSNFSKEALINSGVPTEFIAQIPLLRKKYRADRIQARTSLGVGDNQIVICSFGMIDADKLNKLTVRALELVDEPPTQMCLIFVGPAPDGKYLDELKSVIACSRYRISITGHVEQETYAKYLVAADMAIQLRTNSRGETSGAVLDCMAHGLPLIINEEGSLREYPNDCVLRIETHVTEASLANAIRLLASDWKRRAQMSELSQNYILHNHKPSKVAREYFEFIEETYTRHNASIPNAISRQIARMVASEGAPESLANAAILAAKQNFSRKRFSKLIIDISEISRRAHDGILGSLVRAISKEFLRNPRIASRVELVYMVKSDVGINFLSANRFTEELLGINFIGLLGPERIVNVAQRDTYLSLDFFPEGIFAGVETGLFEQIRTNGGRIAFISYSNDFIDSYRLAEKSDFERRLDWVITGSDISDVCFHVSTDSLKPAECLLDDLSIAVSNISKFRDIMIDIGDYIESSSSSADDRGKALADRLDPDALINFWASQAENIADAVCDSMIHFCDPASC